MDIIGSSSSSRTRSTTTAAAEVPAEVESAMARACKALKALQQRMAPLLPLLSPPPPLHSLQVPPFANSPTAAAASGDLSSLPALQRARLHLVAAQAAAMAYCVLLRTEGVAGEEEAMQQELERLKRYHDKLTRADDHAQCLHRRPLSAAVDPEAASRFIARGLPDLTQDKRKLMYDAGRKRKQQQQQQATAEAKQHKFVGGRGDGSPHVPTSRGSGGGGGSGGGEKVASHGSSVGRDAEEFLAVAAMELDRRQAVDDDDDDDDDDDGDEDDDDDDDAKPELTED